MENNNIVKLLSNSPICEENESYIKISCSPEGKKRFEQWRLFVIDLVTEMIKNKCGLVYMDKNCDIPLSNKDIKFWKTKDGKYSIGVCRKWKSEDIEAIVENWRFESSGIWFELFDDEIVNILNICPEDSFSIINHAVKEEDFNQLNGQYLGLISDGYALMWTRPNTERANSMKKEIQPIYEKYNDCDNGIKQESTCTMF